MVRGKGNKPRSSNSISRKMYKNLYYMLCYAVDELQHMKISDTDAENISSSIGLLAELLLRSLDLWVKNNPLREYKEVSFDTDKPVGKINIYESYRSGIIYSGELNCIQYRLDIDTVQNQIIKLALRILLRFRGDLSDVKIRQLNYYYKQLDTISDLTINQYRLSKISYRTMPSYYKPALAASGIIIDLMIAYNKDGTSRLYDLDDVERYKYIFEKFVRNFYIKEYHKYGVVVKHPSYDVSENKDRSVMDNLDVLLINENNALIIDTKWYTKTRPGSENRNQISMYMYDVFNNEHSGGKYNISGIVLYAKTHDDRIFAYGWDANMKDVTRKFIARQDVIDMTQDFDTIKQSLIDLADNYMGM